MSVIGQGYIGHRPDDAAMSLTTPLTTEERSAVFGMFGNILPKHQMTQRAWEGINMLDIAEFLADKKNVIMSQKLYMMHLLDNTSFINFISPATYIDSNTVVLETASNNFRPMHRVPNGAIPIAVTDNQESIRFSKKIYGLSYSTPLTSLRDKRFGQSILDNALKHFQVSTRLTVDIKNIITWLNEGYNRAVRDVTNGDLSSFISPQRVMFLETQDFLVAAKGEDQFMALINSIRNSAPDIDCLVTPPGFNQFLAYSDKGTADKLDALYRTLDDEGKQLDLFIPGPTNVPIMKNGMYRFELPSYPLSNAGPFNPLINNVTLGQFYSTDAIARKQSYAKQPSRIALYDHAPGEYIPMDDSVALKFTGLFNWQSKTGKSNWSDQVNAYVNNLNATNVGEPRGHSPQDMAEFSDTSIDDVEPIDFSENPDDTESRAPRSQPIFATWDSAETKYFTPKLIGDIERYFLPTGAVMINGKTAAQNIALELNLDASEVLRRFIKTVSILENQPYHEGWITALRNHNIEKIFRRVEKDDGATYIVEGEITPEDLAKAKRITPVVQFRTNQYGSLDLPPITPDLEGVMPIGFLDANAWETIAAERLKPNSPYRAIAQDIGLIVDASRAVVTKLKQLYPGSKIFDPLTRPMNAHMYNPLQCLFDAILPSRLPMFLAVPAPVDARVSKDKPATLDPTSFGDDKEIAIDELNFDSLQSRKGSVKVSLYDEQGKKQTIDLALFTGAVELRNPLASLIAFYGLLTNSARNALKNATITDLAMFTKNVASMQTNETIKALFEPFDNTKIGAAVASAVVLAVTDDVAMIEKFSARIKAGADKTKLIEAVAASITRNGHVARVKSEINTTVKALADAQKVQYLEVLRANPSAGTNFEAYVGNLDSLYTRMFKAGISSEGELDKRLADSPSDELQKIKEDILGVKLSVALQGGDNRPPLDLPTNRFKSRIVIDDTDVDAYANARWFRTPLSCGPHFVKTIPARNPKALPADPFADYAVPASAPFSERLLKHPSMATTANYFEQAAARDYHSLNNYHVARSIAAQSGQGKNVATTPQTARQPVVRVPADTTSGGNELYDVTKMTSPLYTSTKFYPFAGVADESTVGKAVPDQMFQPDVNAALRGPWKHRIVEVPMATPDPFLRFAAYCYLFMPCSGPSIAAMMRQGLFPPFDMVYFRLWITLQTQSIIAIASRGKCCKTMTDQPYVVCSNDTIHRELSWQSYLNFAPVVVNTDNLVVRRNVAPHAYLGGLNVNFFKIGSNDIRKPVDSRPSVIVAVKPLTERLAETFRFDNSELAHEFGKQYNRGYNKTRWSMGNFYKEVYASLISIARQHEANTINNYARKGDSICLTVCRGPYFSIGQQGTWIGHNGTGPCGLLTQNCLEANAVLEGRKTRFPTTVDVRVQNTPMI